MLTPEEWRAVQLSLLVGTVAVAASLAPAIAIAWLLARWRGPGRWLLQGLVDLPLVLPPVVTGYLLLVLLGPRGPIGLALETHLGLRLAFTWWGAAVASAVVSFPLMVRAIRGAFQSIDPRLERAARSLGAGPLAVFWTVTLPLARHGLVAGCLLGFARSIGEFGATIMLAGDIPGETRTIPLAIYSLGSRVGGLDEAWRLVVVAIALAFAALLIGEHIDRRSHDERR